MIFHEFQRVDLWPVFRVILTRIVRTQPICGKPIQLFLVISIRTACAAQAFRQIWLSFPEISLAHDRKIEISRKSWMSFPQIGPDIWKTGHKSF